MNIILHSPETPQAIDALSRRVGETHAELVLARLRRQPMTREACSKLLQTLLKGGTVRGR